MTNVDNINADQVPYLIEQLMGKGAKNVHVVNAITKKGRPEYIFSLMFTRIKLLIGQFLASEIGTLGVRIIKADHMSYDYSMETIKLSLLDKNKNIAWQGSVQVKIVQGDSGILLSARVEYEDLKATAKAIELTGAKISFHELKQMIEMEALKKLKKTDFLIRFEED
jgi:uncharacterized protein (DUF111 family)